MAVCTAACGDEKNGGDVTGAGTTDDTIGMSSTPTTGERPASTTSETGDETTAGMTGGGPTTGAVTTEAATTGAPVDPDAQSLCQAFCDKRPVCELPPDEEACMQGCLAELAERDPGCGEATRSLFECFVELACAQYVPLATDGDPGPCDGYVDYQTFVCDLGGCDAGGGIHDDMGCSFEKICPDAPLRRMECDAMTCTCFLEDEPFATCDVEDACAEVYASALRAKECCGF